MKPDRWPQIEELYHAAARLEPAERRSFFQNECSHDESLLRELESLLAYGSEAEGFLETPAVSDASRASFLKAPGLAAGQIFGHFQIVSPLGAGGMGEVYRAKDLRLGREVAIKILPAHLASHPEALARFEREAKAVAALSHPGIVAIHEFGLKQGVSYAVTELLEGESLRSRLGRSALPWHEAVETGTALADALGAVHAKGIIHRDLKPENIFLTSDGRVKILDFGLAHMKPMLIGADPKAEAMYLTAPGLVMGTVGYMSPEQAEGKSVDARSDIFSFGALLYEMITGRQPFQGDSKISMLAAILHLEPKPMRDIAPAAPRDLERIVLRCLRKKPDERYQDIDSVKRALQLVSQRAPATGLAWAANHWRAAASVGAAIFFIVASLAVFAWLGNPKAERTAAARAAVAIAERVRSSDVSCYGPPHGIIGWWPGEGSAANIVGPDSGVPANGLNFAPGKVGQAFNFDGVASHVRLGDSKSLAPPDITVEFWINARSVRPDYNHVAARWGHMYSRWANSWIFNYDATRSMSFCVQTEVSRFESCAFAKSNLTLNTWHHVAGTFDSAESKIRFYLDGRQEGEQQHHGTMQASGSIAAIGCKYAEATCLYPFNGLIDEFSIYERALVPQEIQAIFSAGPAGKCRPLS